MSELSCKRQWYKASTTTTTTFTLNDTTTYADTTTTTTSTRRFKVLDLNCLAPSLVDTQRYKECDQDCLDANTRVRAIKNEIRFFDPDIICLQELEWVDFKSLTFSTNYQGTYVQHVPSRRIDGTAILWKPSLFKLCHSETITPLPNSAIDKYLRSAAAVLTTTTPPVCSVTARGHTTTPPTTSQKLIVVSSHLLFNCGRSDVKCYQIAHISSAIHDLKLKFSKLSSPEPLSTTTTTTTSPVLVQRCLETPSIIWCGDFNMTPMSPLYSLLMTRVPDEALYKVAEDALSCPDRRSISQKLLSGQQILFFNESHRRVPPTTTLTVDPTLRKFLSQELLSKPIRRRNSYLGNSIASRVHQWEKPVASNLHLRIWFDKIGPKLDPWTSSCFISTKDSRVEKIQKALNDRQIYHWICPINLKSAQCLKLNRTSGRGEGEGGGRVGRGSGVGGGGSGVGSGRGHGSGSEDEVGVGDGKCSDVETLLEPCYTAFHREQSGCIDFMWYSPETLKVVGICAQAIGPETPHTPSIEYPVSDHLPIVIEFAITPPDSTCWYVQWKDKALMTSNNVIPGDTTMAPKATTTTSINPTTSIVPTTTTTTAAADTTTTSFTTTTTTTTSGSYFEKLMFDEYGHWLNDDVHCVTDLDAIPSTPGRYSTPPGAPHRPRPCQVGKILHQFTELGRGRNRGGGGGGGNGSKKRNWSSDYSTRFRNEHT